MYLSCGFYFRQERRIACYAEKDAVTDIYVYFQDYVRKYITAEQ